MKTNRIDKKFKELKARKKKAFIAYITAGDPSLKTTEQLVLAFEKSGVDIVELGVPFSDPLADGPTIQAAAQRALKQKVTLSKILRTVKAIRKSSQIPIALMTYYNPVFRFGEEKFIKQCNICGVDGVIVPDLPPEEAACFIKAARKNDVTTVFFLSPTTRKSRIKTIINASTGFIYYVSLTGVTGARKILPASVTTNVREIKRLTKKPICVGFGISQREQVKSISRIADGVIVGSAIIKKIAQYQKPKDCVKKATQFVKGLTAVI